MSLTLKEALNFGGLFGATVVAGEEGLDKKIESVSVLEVAESGISKWVLKNQLYITSFYAISDNVEQQKIVIESLMKYGCCGLVLCYVGVWIQEIDIEIIKFCNKKGFPLIQARADVSYIEIMNPIINYLYEEDTQASAINDYSMIRNDFLDLIVNEENTESILKKINQRLGKKISYYDTYGKLIFSDENEKSIKADEEYLDKNLNSILYACSQNGYTIKKICEEERLIVLIRSKKNLFGFFITNKIQNGAYDLQNDFINPLVVSGALILRKRNRMGSLREKAMEDYVADLLVWNFPSLEKAIERGKELGVSIQDKDYIVLININPIQRTGDLKVQREMQDYVKRVIMPQIENYVKSQNPKNWITLRSDTIILFISSENQKKDMRTFCNYILEIFKMKKNPSVSIGVCNEIKNVIELPEAYRQAFRAAILGREYYGDNKIIFYNSVYFLRKIRQLGKQVETKMVCNEYLAPVLEYDSENGTELFKTLELLIENSANTQRVAQLLYVHKNTVLQRKNKILDLLGFSPFEMPYLLNFLVIFTILKEK